MIWYYLNDEFQMILIKINEVEANIDLILRERFDLLNKSVGIIKSNSELTDVLDSIVKLRSRKISNYDLDRYLKQSIEEFNHCLKNNDYLKDIESIDKIKISLKESELELTTFKNYYNDNAFIYNEMIKKIPTCIVAIIKKYTEKEFYGEKEIS